MQLIDILIVVALAAVLVTLALGVLNLYRKPADEAGAVRSNRLMRLRVALQAVAIVLLVIGFWIKAKG